MKEFNVIVSKIDNNYWLDILANVNETRQGYTKKISKTEAMTIMRQLDLKLHDIDKLKQPELDFQNK